MLEIVYEKDLSFRIRVVDSEYLLIGNNQSRNINQSAYLCLQIIDGEKTVNEIIKELAKCYNKDFDEIKDYIMGYVKSLENQGIIHRIK